MYIVEIFDNKDSQAGDLTVVNSVAMAALKT